jgi:DNA-binding protein HU-beta
MTRTELIQHLATESNLSAKQVDQLLKQLEATCIEIISNQDTLKLPGFLTLGVKERAARVTRNPRTGETMNTPARKVAYIKVGSKLKAAIADKAKPSSKQKAA